MAAKKNPLADEARELYRKGMKLVDIAAGLGVPDGTVRRWKKTYRWEEAGQDERSRSHSERSETKKEKGGLLPQREKSESLPNDDLPPKWQLFCLLYARTFNATQSYRKVYGCDWATANACGPRLLGNVRVREEIERLKEEKRQQIVAGAEDIVELQMRIAFADMGDYLEFDRKGVRLRESEETDTQLIKEVKEGKNGVAIKLADSSKAIDWLSKYFTLHPNDRFRAEYERKRAQLDRQPEEVWKNMQTVAEILSRPAENREIEELEGEDREHTGAAE